MVRKSQGKWYNLRVDENERHIGDGASAVSRAFRPRGGEGRGKCKV